MTRVISHGLLLTTAIRRDAVMMLRCAADRVGLGLNSRLVTVGNVLFDLGYGSLAKAEDLAISALAAVPGPSFLLDEYIGRCLEAALRLERGTFP